MFWLFALPFLLLVVGAAIRLPYDMLAHARRNTRRADGSRSERRTRREAAHAAGLLWRAVGLPLVVMLAAAGGMRAVHLWVMPDVSVAPIFGDYHPETSLHAPDLEAWEEAIEATRRERAYRAWREAQGLDAPAPPSLRDQLAEHWPLHAVFPLLLLAFALWYVLRVLPDTVAAYRAGVLSRGTEYLRRDHPAMLG